MPKQRSFRPLWNQQRQPKPKPSLPPPPEGFDRTEASSLDTFLQGEGGWWIEQGHVLDVLRKLPDSIIQCVVTSVPYWALRSYSTVPQIWGGDGSCDSHEWSDSTAAPVPSGGTGASSIGHGKGQITNAGSQAGNHARGEERVVRKGGVGQNKELDNSDGYRQARDTDAQVVKQGAFCTRCGAWRGELGLEPDPSLWVAHMVEIFTEVRRVLRPDGLLFLNCGDAYSGSGKGRLKSGLHSSNAGDKQWTNHGSVEGRIEKARLKDVSAFNLPAKSLLMLPARLAIALQDDGWLLRAEIVWSKQSPMPESVTDRVTRSHEMIYMFAKQGSYFYDAEAIKEHQASEHPSGNGFKRDARLTYRDDFGARGSEAQWQPSEAGRNARSVWSFPPEPQHTRLLLHTTKDGDLEAEESAHYAAFPTSLPTRTFLAGTSAYGACASCGSPYRRVTTREPVPQHIQEQFNDARQRTADDHGRSDGFTTRKPNYSRQVLDTTWEPTCSCSSGLSPDDLEVINTPTGERVGDDPTMLTGRKGMNRPRGENEGTRPITRYEQRQYAAQLRDSSARETMQAEAGEAFAHYIRTDRSGARPVPDDLLERWIGNGWLERVILPQSEPLPPVPCLTLDIFSGSGTSALAALRIGRRALGIELNPSYVAASRQRINDDQPESLLGSRVHLPT